MPINKSAFQQKTLKQVLCKNLEYYALKSETQSCIKQHRFICNENKDKQTMQTGTNQEPKVKRDQQFSNKWTSQGNGLQLVESDPTPEKANFGRF